MDHDSFGFVMPDPISPNEPELNPYAPPLADIGPPVPRTAEESQARRYAAREGMIRAGGLIGLILSVLMLATFGLGFLSEFRNIAAAEGRIDPWKYRVYIARTVTSLSVIALAVVTNLGLLRLRRWARSALSYASILPLTVLMLGYLALRFAGTQEGKGSLIPRDLAMAAVALGLFRLPIRYLLWSRAGVAVFADDYLETSRQAGEKRFGCLPIMGAFAFVFVQGIVYTGLTFTLISVLKYVGLVPSL